MVQAGRVGNAAKLLHVSQPAVSAQIHQLEEECGRPLLQRTARGAKPNAWGLRLLETAQRILALLGASEQAIRQEPAGDAVLGASMTTSAYVIPQLLAGYRAIRGPALFRLQVLVRNPATLLT